jgi:copper chaperone
MKNKLWWILFGVLVIAVAFFVVRGLSRSESVVHSQLMTVTLPVAGMTCESCQKTVRDGLLGLPGVRTVDVDLSAESTTITYDQSMLIVQSLVETISSLGFESRVPTKNQLEVVNFKMKIN